jgi:hypothetical protein
MIPVKAIAGRACRRVISSHELMLDGDVLKGREIFIT